MSIRPGAAWRRPPWWLTVSLAGAALVLATSVHDAVSWIGRPFAGLLFLDSAITVSIGRPGWRPAQLRQTDWARVVAVEGQPVGDGTAVHAAVRAAAPGAALTYTLHRGRETFRVTLPVRTFTWDDFVAVFAPMLGVGAWLVAASGVLACRRPELPSMRALYAACLALGLVLVTGPDEYGPYRFTPLFLVALAALPPALVQLTAAYPWRPGPWADRVVIVVYVVFGALAALLVSRRADPRVFLPVLYLVYCAVANALLLYVASLVSALVTRRRPRAELLLALSAIVGSSAIGLVVIVTYPLLVAPVSAPWLVVPAALMPVLSGLAFAREHPGPETRPR